MGSESSVVLVKDWLKRGQLFHPDNKAQNITKLNSRHKRELMKGICPFRNESVLSKATK